MQSSVQELSPKHESAAAFKRAQVRYRRQGGDPDRIDDLNDFVDFSFPEEDGRIKLVSDKGIFPANGLSPHHGTVYGLKDFPGLLYIPQALSPDVQMCLAYQALTDYCEKPHATNIDLQPPKSHETMNSDERMWDLWKLQQVSPTESRSRSRGKKYYCFDKLSWATSGYQYDWTARAYNEQAKSPVPSLLQEISTHFATISLQIEKGATKTNFCPSACIVNYYNEKSVMGGHRDDLEYALDKPVISLNLGLPGVFLLGGVTKDDTVIPILIRPGDVLVLGGSSRMNYHGMARVLSHRVELPTAPLKTDYDLFKSVSEVPEGDINHVQQFLRKHRININIRQVLPDGVLSINDMKKA